MDLNKENYKRFDILNDSYSSIEPKGGNYIVALREGSELPGELKPEHLPTITFDGKEYRVVYTGVGQNIHDRIKKCHYEGTAGTSTFRKSLGALMGFQPVPRDSKYEENKKTKFGDDAENKVTDWMINNLIFFHHTDVNYKEIEKVLIFVLNPPLNLESNHNTVNQAFRKELSDLRNNKDKK